MLKLYRLSESQAEAAALVGLDDIERRQHVQQLTHRVLAGCKQASQPFTWIRAAGLKSIASAIAAGLENGQALTAVLEATYSQVLEVILSTLDRDLIPAHLTDTAFATAHQQENNSSNTHSSQAAADLLAAVGRCPGGYAPAAASSAELQEAFTVLQALCLLHPKARSVLCKAQYLQLVTARACEAPACLPSALNTLLTLLQGNEEAQGLFVTTGGMDMLLTRTLQHLRPCRSSDDSSSVLVDGSGLTRRELAVQLLLFVQLLQHWVIAEAVKSGAHPSTQRAALALVVNHLGPDVAAGISEGVSAASEAAANATDTLSSPEAVWQQRAEAAADKLLDTLISE